MQSGKFYIVMSCLKGGELLDALLDLDYTEEDAKCISKQLLGRSRACTSAASAGDLKLENLLLASERHKLRCDRGFRVSREE